MGHRVVGWLLGVLGDLGNSIGNIYTSPSLLPETRDCLFCAVIQIIKLIWSIQTIYVVDKFSIVDRVEKFGVDFDAIFVRQVFEPTYELIEILIKFCLRRIILLGSERVLR